MENRSNSIDIVKAAVKGLNSLFKEGYYYKTAGVIVMNLTPETHQQLSLFDPANPKHRNLMKVVDKLNFNFGQNVKFAGQDPKKVWKMKQEKLSPRYSTNINEVIRVKCREVTNPS